MTPLHQAGEPATGGETRLAANQPGRVFRHADTDDYAGVVGAFARDVDQRQADDGELSELQPTLLQLGRVVPVPRLEGELAGEVAGGHGLVAAHRELTDACAEPGLHPHDHVRPEGRGIHQHVRLRRPERVAAVPEPA